MKPLKHLHKQYDQKLTTENQFSKNLIFDKKENHNRDVALSIHDLIIHATPLQLTQLLRYTQQTLTSID